jgi:chaperonin GroEL (HSP60 family)
MKDIEAVVGGRYIDTEESSLDDVYISDVGFTRKIIAKQFNSVITGIDNEQSKARITKRAELLEKKLIGSQSDFEKRAIEERIAQLTGGFAILKVGSRSVTERKRLKDKADDAVNAVRLALKGGTVKGGGLAFKEISDKMEEDDILKRPLCIINEQIMSSAPDDFVIESWVRDPYLVLKCALENACEFASAYISINGIVTTKNKKEKDE